MTLGGLALGLLALAAQAELHEFTCQLPEWCSQ